MDVFNALAEPHRRNIIELLANGGELSATDICKKFHISAPAISQHLKVLRAAKLVKVEKRAQQRIYKINTQALIKVDEWIKKIIGKWTNDVNALSEPLEDKVIESKNNYILNSN
jgi:DNA-binding transcriptional ArsR family regulator